MIRILDVLISASALLFGAPLLVLLTLVGLLANGAPVFRQVRVGRNQQTFTLFKFRTMQPEAPSVATHLAAPDLVTPYGRLLRKTKLDELPQLWNVLKGEMSMVGPRPCLSNQIELIAERELRGVFKVRPGITGLAQIKGIDMSTPELLAEVDAEMIRSLSIPRYFSYLFLTAIGRGGGDRAMGNRP